MKNPLILLIEDDANDEELIRLALEENGIMHDLSIVRDGPEALDFLFCKGPYQNREFHNPYLIILDLKIPKISGTEVLKQIRANQITCHIPVVIFTSSREEKDIRNCYQLGANAFVRKPIEFTEFNESIRSISTFWLTHNNIMEGPA